MSKIDSRSYLHQGYRFGSKIHPHTVVGSLQWNQKFATEVRVAQAAIK